jgi:hypothetical protein
MPSYAKSSDEVAGTRSPVLLAKEISCTKSEVVLTLDALAGKLAARPFVEKVMLMLKQVTNGNNGAAFAGGERLRANSLPLTLIGLGFAWLIASESGLVEKLPADELISGLRRRIAPSKAKEAPSGKTDGELATGFVSLARTAGERISNYAGVAGEGASRLGTDVLATIERHPLLFGALGLVAGAALATLMPTGKSGADGGEERRSTGG